MSRSLRIEIENGLYHVTSRGWERRLIVRDDRDREQWNKLVDRVVTRFGWRVFACPSDGLIRRLTSVSATTLADQYGDVSQAAISKTIKRAEIRGEEQRSWKRKLRRLEKSLRNKDSP